MSADFPQTKTIRTKYGQDVPGQTADGQNSDTKQRGSQKPENMTEEERKYYNLKLKTKHTWVKCIIKNRFAAGVSTASRIESMYKVLKDNLISTLNSQSYLKHLLKLN